MSEYPVEPNHTDAPLETGRSRVEERKSHDRKTMIICYDGIQTAEQAPHRMTPNAHHGGTYVADCIKEDVEGSRPVHNGVKIEPC